MPIERLKPTFSFDEERLRVLEQVVPEAFADGKINWEALREVLGQRVEDDEAAPEHFGLFWPGKREARRLAAQLSKGTLVPAPGEGLDEETTDNIFVEGENLEVLKLLQKSYAGRIKMIYIDPPYNTGSDLIYKDNFTEPLGDYLRKTGQVGEEGELLTTNTKASGRFHSEWLNMIYPRLRLAWNLLRDDGVIFVSIDNTEIHNLRHLMNEIFGEENFIEQITWKSKYGAGAKTKGFITVHEYILCYSKAPLSNIETPLSEAEKAGYNKKDSKYSTRGGYVTQPLATTSMDERANLRYPIPYKGKEIWPEKQWVWSKERALKALANDELVINEKNGKFSVRFKQYVKDENGNYRRGKPTSIFNGPFTQEGTDEIAELFGKAVFDFPKPSQLIKYLFSAVINEDDDKNGIYLDFFSGSGTSAQALFQLNAEDLGSRKFICVQLPQKIDPKKEAFKEGYKTLADLCKERIRRASKKTKRDLSTKLDLDGHEHDFGFKVLKLEKSNFRAWDDYRGENLQQLETLFSTFETPVVDGWHEQGVLIEVLLIEGFPLHSKVLPTPDFIANKVMQIESDFSAHRLFICLEPRVKNETIEHLALLPEDDIFVCLDSALDDAAKVRLNDVGRVRTI